MAILSDMISANGSECRSSDGMAATSQPLATAAAIELLQAGGTAMDAAIAANAVLGVVEPTGCGIGGDLFAIVWDPTSENLHGLNASGRSPKSLTLEKLTERLSIQLSEVPGDQAEIPTSGPQGITVPGCVDGWFELHGRFGRLDMERILSPAIHAADKGFVVTPVIAQEWEHDLERIRCNAHLLPDLSDFLECFAPTGSAPRAGNVHVNPALARSLRQIASRGRDAFYKGFVADAMVSAVGRAGGFLNEEDLAAHSSEWVNPIATSYRGFDVFELPPNNQGVTVLQMLRMIESFDLAKSGFGTAETLHVLIESKKLAFEDRARFISDPEFAASTVEHLLSSSRLFAQRAKIKMDSILSLSEAQHSMVEKGDTCYLTTADRDGMMVSLIQSNFLKLGSGVVPRGLGFCLQNRGALFALDGNHPNGFAPSKRPFHTIIPAFVMRGGRPVLSFGVMGGAMQPQGHVQILTNLIDFGMSLQQAGDAPRWRHIGSGRPTGFQGVESGAVLHEPGFDIGEMAALLRKGHVLMERDEPDLFGGYQAIGIEPATGDYVGASESRKDGMAMGV